MPMQRKIVIRSDAQGYAQAERGRHKLYVCLCSAAQTECVDLIPFARLLRKRDFFIRRLTDGNTHCSCRYYY